MGPQSGGIVASSKVSIAPMNVKRVFAGLASDSREVRAGYLFAALPGSREDGARFIADAVKRGASAILGVPAARASTEALGVSFIADENPRLRLAQIAAAYFGAQPDVVAAVTGTNGKTSVAVFLRQIWELQGIPAASMGTIGVVAPSGVLRLEHTTPDPIETHRLLAQLKHDGVEHLALEASSHGLDQYRLDGVAIEAVGFTNLTRDHLDYHSDLAHYLGAKLRLFTELVRAGGVAVVNADAGHADQFIRAARIRGLKLVTVGERGETLRLLAHEAHGDGQSLTIAYDGQEFGVELPLVGDFQASNALVAAGLAIGLGNGPPDVFAALACLAGAPGRLEKVAYAASGAPVYTDYAHTPDALETVLTAIRPHVRDRLHLVFGCGGDRDRGKRLLMGAAAARLADAVIVTDDNPRSEEPGAIRREILAGCPQAEEIGDRAQAIRMAIARLDTGDVLVIAGKGHETGQIIGDETHPFHDAQAAIDAALTSGGKAGRAQPRALA